MLKLALYKRSIKWAIALALLALPGILPAYGQVQVGGDFMVRVYSLKYFDTRDNRDDLNYLRLAGKLHVDAPIGDVASVHTDFVTISENPVFRTRAIGGSGSLLYGIAQIYGEVLTPDVPLVDLARLRVGRQHYMLGQGLTLGSSYYMTDNYDGLRVDLSRGLWTFGYMGAVTAQEVSEGGYNPEPGGNHIHVAKLEYDLYDHVLLGYYVYEKQLGVFNDNTIIGLGSTGSIVLSDLEYFGEFATQKFNTLPGLPDKGGIAYMAGVSYSWTQGPFRIIKAEVRTAGYQGDDAKTDKVETFEPFYPTWWWGDQTAYVNGDIGGDYPHRGIQMEGSRVWYGRIYVSPKAVPKVRLQLQYANVDDWVNNDDITEPDDEFGIKLYYEASSNIRFQARYFRRIANAEDADINDSGTITKSEDRYNVQRMMMEFRFKF